MQWAQNESRPLQSIFMDRGGRVQGLSSRFVTMVPPNADIQRLAGIQMHIALRERNHDTGIVELLIDRFVQLGQGWHTVILCAHETAQGQV